MSLSNLPAPRHEDSGEDGKQVDSGLSLPVTGALTPSTGRLLEDLIRRIDRLEQRKPVSEHPATPHPAAANPRASATASASGLAPGVSVSQFLFGSGGEGVDEDEPAGPAGTSSASASASSLAPAPHPLHQRLAPQVIEDVGPAGFKEWLRSEAPADGWQNKRNLYECEVLAEALDALVLKDDPAAAVEVLVRRFVGVRNADKSGNWNFASVLASSAPRRTLLRPSVLSAVLREAKNLSLLEHGGRMPTRAEPPARGAKKDATHHATSAQGAPGASATNASRAGGGARQ